jgi:hypothetical protein
MSDFVDAMDLSNFGKDEEGYASFISGLVLRDANVA